jgi:hypothetical protein
MKDKRLPSAPQYLFVSERLWNISVQRGSESLGTAELAIEAGTSRIRHTKALQHLERVMPRFLFDSQCGPPIAMNSQGSICV